MTEKKEEWKIKYSYPKSALVTLHVNDMDRAIQFYQDVFDYKVSWNEARQLGWVEITTHLDGLFIGLIESVHGLAENQIAFTINVSNIEETRDYLISKGVDTTKIEEFAGMISMFFFVDSEGNRIAIASSSRK
ncbi:MAG: VOC family protein [Candidatus Heimdallarchaeota archaeon]|nr:VOC family protein [Candidatus Heimdallarchaeota archaeon]MCK5144189.1 VOC family protein [Candidatus Heimdallarchaeota archaeon]